MFDGGTDIGWTSVLIIYIKYVKPDGSVVTNFHSLLELKGKDADSLVTALLHNIEKSRLELRRWASSGSNGSSTMTGALNGVGLPPPALYEKPPRRRAQAGAGLR